MDDGPRDGGGATDSACPCDAATNAMRHLPRLQVRQHALVARRFRVTHRDGCSAIVDDVEVFDGLRPWLAPVSARRVEVDGARIGIVGTKAGHGTSLTSLPGFELGRRCTA